METATASAAALEPARGQAQDVQLPRKAPRTPRLPQPAKEAQDAFRTTKIAGHRYQRDQHRFLAANQAPGFRSIARFRQRHLAAIEDLYVQVLRIAHRAGLITLGQVAVDGTKLRADASRHKAMSYDRMSARERELAAEIEALHRQVRAQLADAEDTDAAAHPEPKPKAQRNFTDPDSRIMKTADGRCISATTPRR